MRHRRQNITNILITLMYEYITSEGRERDEETHETQETELNKHNTHSSTHSSGALMAWKILGNKSKSSAKLQTSKSQ